MAQGTEAPAKDDRHATASSNCHRLFSVEQAADHADEPIYVIRHWINVGWLEAYHLEGGLRIDEVELDQFLASLEARQP